MGQQQAEITRADMIEWIAAGETDPVDFRLGTEHEKFGFHMADLSPLAYEGEAGIGALLKALVDKDWEGVYEGDHLIALKNGMASITLEPGGQLELSGAPLESVHQTCTEVNRHLAQVRAVAEPMGIGFLGMGFHPSAKREEIPWMPKGRYKIMRAHMPRVGSMGLDMMLRTCTVQVNLDYATEADMVQKFRVAMALQPIATAMFANSPFVEGKLSGFQSYRAHVWSDTDPHRSGMLPFVFESGMSYERYVDYMLDVPMYFVYRNGQYIDAAGQSFRDFLDGKLPALPGERPTMQDFEDHLTTAFPEVRLKRFLEMRGADGGPWHRLCALPALWAGLLYDQTALDAASDLIKPWSFDQLQSMYRAVPRHGFEARIGDATVGSVAKEVMEIALTGLKSRNFTGSCGSDESLFLQPLVDIVDSGITPAQRKIEKFTQQWQEDVSYVFKECAY